jgi:uncharacterized membrane protein
MVFCLMTPCDSEVVSNVSDERTVSIFRAESARYRNPEGQHLHTFIYFPFHSNFFHSSFCIFFFSHLIIIIIISGSTVLVRTLVTSHWRLSNLFWHLVGLLWTSDQPVAKAPTYTGQHNVETQRQISMRRTAFEPTIPVTKRPRPTP